MYYVVREITLLFNINCQGKFIFTANAVSDFWEMQAVAFDINNTNVVVYLFFIFYFDEKGNVLIFPL